VSDTTVPDDQNETLQTIQLDENEAAFCIGICYFERAHGEPYLVVGTGMNTTLAPRSSQGGWLRLYEFADQGKTLKFLHKVGHRGGFI
jgi:splicing factor 3B subunit 3